MEIKRGKKPETVERTVVVEITREEVLSVLVSAVKRQFGNAQVRFEDVEVIGSPEFKLEGINLVGIETIKLNWPEEKPAPAIEAPPANP